jgi:hypothetical protein
MGSGTFDNCTPNIAVSYNDVFTEGCGMTGVIQRTWTAQKMSVEIHPPAYSSLH